MRLNSFRGALALKSSNRSSSLIMKNLSFLELLEKVIHILTGVLSRMEHLLHHLFDHFILLSDETNLTLELGFQLLILLYLLVQLFFNMNLFFVQTFFVCVFQAVRQVSFLVQILFCFLVCKVCNALQLFRRLQLVLSCGLRSRSLSS